MSEEWGPWIEHDGKGCPCEGMFVHAIRYKASDILLLRRQGHRKEAA